MPLIGFDVNVAGAIACGLGEQGVEHADDGRVVRGLQQVFNGRQLLHHAAEVGVALHLAHHRRCAGLALGIGCADTLRQCACAMALHLSHRIFAQRLANACGQGCWLHMQGQALCILFQQQLLAACKSIGQRITHIRAWPSCLATPQGFPAASLHPPPGLWRPARVAPLSCPRASGHSGPATGVLWRRCHAPPPGAKTP